MNLKSLKLILLPILIGFSLNANAGGMMKGGGPSLFKIVFILSLIFIGIPIVVGAIISFVSKTKKKRNFFLGFLLTLAAILLILLALVNIYP